MKKSANCPSQTTNKTIKKTLCLGPFEDDKENVMARPWLC